MSAWLLTAIVLFKQKVCLTMRAPDKWDSARFSSLFLASGFFRFQTESTPAHLRVTQTVGRKMFLTAQAKEDENGYKL
jgi:hypothetical protein